MTVPGSVRLTRHIGDLDDNGHDTYSSISAALDDLTDVTITSATAGDRLRYSGTTWVNSALVWVPVMDGLGNVVTDSGTGQAIVAEVSL